MESEITIQLPLPVTPLEVRLPDTASDIFDAELPHLDRFDKNLIRLLLFFTRKFLVGVSGLENLSQAGPFILVANHNERLEALLLPIWLAYFRQGKLVHFMADWNFRLIPFVSMILRHGRTIPVMTKSSRPKFFNRYKKRIAGDCHGFDLAKKYLAEGDAVGIFPEGMTNPDPRCLLRGRLGAAKLSLETGVPILPVGIRFPFQDRSKPIPLFAQMEIEIGAPIYPPECENKQVFRDSDVRTLHSVLMQHLAALSGKYWNPLSSRRTRQ